MFSTMNYIILFVILISLAFLYHKLEKKRIVLEDKENNDIIKKYLLGGDNTGLGKLKKPIIWIHIPYEYNSRNWLSFGSRSSNELNQPYLYLTLKSIINYCNDSFHICLIDDKSFEKLIEDWDVDMSKISSPILEKVRTLALSKILYNYGGMIVPISFLCMKNLNILYEKGTIGDKVFICENINKSSNITNSNFGPDISFMGSKKDNKIVKEFIEYTKSVIATDYTADSIFSNKLNEWYAKNIKNGEIIIINGKEIGVKDMENKPITIENLLGQNYIDLYPVTYGIYIPSDEILLRRQYEWFSRLSKKQVLEADTILSKYILLASANGEKGVIEGLEQKPAWVGFWKTPLITTWSIKPNLLGDNLLKEKYPDY